MEFKKSKSVVKPEEFDDKSSSGGIYIRINITETNSGDVDYWEYDEAFLSHEEWEQYCTIQTINGKDVNIAQIEYDQKMDTPVVYPENGFTYKPKWAENIYVNKITLGTALPSLFPLKIYDSTDLQSRMQEMSVVQLTQLSVFLGEIQKQYFDEYKIHKALLG